MDGTDKFISRRAAAQKAQKLAADQLNNSSSDESTAASGRRQNKSAKARDRRLPGPKGTKPAKSMSNLSSMHLDTNLKDMSTASSQHSRRQSFSSQAIPAGPSQRDAPFVSDSDSDIEIIGFRRPGEPHTISPSHVHPHSTTMSSTSVSGPALKTPLAKKRVLSTAELSPVTSAGSLTPLTSPEAIRGRSHSGFTSGRIDEPSSPAVEEWSLDTLGRLVWVRIDISGNISRSRVDSVWWPSKVC